jgi:hypothetical protein
MYSLDPMQIGALNVWIIDLKTGSLDLMWSLNKGSENAWKQGAFSYLKANTLHRIVFEGVRGDGIADIALDDVLTTSGSDCAIEPSDAKPSISTTQMSSTTVTPSTTPSVPLNPNDCDFERDLCSWENDFTSTFNWTRTKASDQVYTESNTNSKFHHIASA